MKKNKKSIVFLVIIFTCILGFIIKNKLNLTEDVYVISQSEERTKESILLDNKTTEEMTSQNNINYNSDVEQLVTIYISGQVKNPGIVTLENDRRLVDAIEILGGVTEEADLNKVNMALKIEDEGHYIIPKLGEEVETQSIDLNSTEKAKNENDKVNINIANIDELQSLPGVGEATANKIFKYREENGVFKNIEEIKNVNGIGDKKYEGLRDLISIN
ncbi:helix-hairpin-helix domain-containing protein [Romboutsia sp. 1001713B170207_170306_H8]|uniref:helix-hairpin-helix domain-containing protein n=1 Tax=Romboutsia sp. 1001713B170207_170306_H8 TaxID=2787112 RepID=UPI002ED12198